MPSRTPRAPARPRVRRTPEEARTLILDAAERVFAEHLPDTVGLKDVAREAGVSHALVTHYFGTYDGLVEAALERKLTSLREGIAREIVAVVADGGGPSRSLAGYRRAVSRAAADPVAVRLAIWAMLSGRANAKDFVSHRAQGLKLLVDAMATGSRAPREDLELAVVASLALSVVWALGRAPLAGALGKRASRELDAAYEAQVAEMIDGFLARRR